MHACMHACMCVLRNEYEKKIQRNKTIVGKKLTTIKKKNGQ